MRELVIDTESVRVSYRYGELVIETESEGVIIDTEGERVSYRYGELVIETECELL